ncbi:hypothetical protein MMC25_004856 [Agyrium rufum]|nr:hypothetical protein [Agyrium rufum]
MASIANGLAAFHPRTVLPFTSGFFMFYLYAAAGVRMGAVQGLQVIHLATHDSIAIGEDGPSHQPIALPALFRAMPNLFYMRPCDAEETYGAFMIALTARTYHDTHCRNFFSSQVAWASQKGAYVFVEQKDADVTLIGIGSEMVFAVTTRDELMREGIKVRIVSFPCQRIFEAQFPQHRESVMQFSRRKPIIVIEAYTVNGWERYADAGYTMRSFGTSLPAEDKVYSYFGFESGKIAAAIMILLEKVKTDGLESLRGNFQDLSGGAIGEGLDLRWEVSDPSD